MSRNTRADPDAAGDLSAYDLVVVGRFVYSDGASYCVPEQRWAFLRELAAPFREATYVCFADELPERGEHVEVDPDVLALAPNEAWHGDGSVPRRLASLRADAAAVGTDADGLVTYTYYPGTYSFLLAPVVLRRGDVTVSYFGKAAAVTTVGFPEGRPLTRLRRALYPRAERYVVDRSDATFVRDPRVGGTIDDPAVRLSKPVTDAAHTVEPAPPVDPVGDPVELLYVASFRPPKGHESLVDALAVLRDAPDRDREYRLRLVGDGATRDHIERLVDRRGLSDAVDFRGYVSDAEQLRREYETADMFVLPSETEGFPRVLNEAMAAGLPVVATRVGGIPALLDEREHALLVEPRDPRALASAVETVVADPDLRRRLVERGAAFAREQSGDPVEQHLDAIRQSLR